MYKFGVLFSHLQLLVCLLPTGCLVKTNLAKNVKFKIKTLICKKPERRGKEGKKETTSKQKRKKQREGGRKNEERKEGRKGGRMDRRKGGGRQRLRQERGKKEGRKERNKRFNSLKKTPCYKQRE